MNFRTLTAFGCIGVILAACGGGNGNGDVVGTAPGTTPTGGGGGTTSTPAGIPASAVQSVDSFVAYLRQLVVDETSEPLPLPDAALPTSDTTEPA